MAAVLEALLNLQKILSVKNLESREPKVEEKKVQEKEKKVHKVQRPHHRRERGNTKEDGKNRGERKHQTAFLQLNYPYVDLTDENSVAIFKKPEGKSDSKIRPIIYVNRPLKDGKKIVFHIRETINGDYKQKFVFTFGLTTCHSSRVMEHYFHVNEYCKDGQMECKGYSSVIPIFVEDKNVKCVEVKKLDKGALCSIKTIFKNGESKTRTFKDATEGLKITSAGQVYPFIVLEGFATKVQIREYPVEPTTKTASSSRHPNSSIPKVNFSMSPNSWIIGSGIELNNFTLKKKPYGQSLYALSKSPLAPGQKLKFIIDEICPDITGTLTIGFTTIDLSSLNVNGLPSPLELPKKLWKTCINVLASSQKGQEFLMKYDENGIQITTNGQTFPLIRKDQIRSNSHMFFHFGGKVTEVKFVPKELKKPILEQAVAPAPGPYGRNGACVYCIDKEANFILVPCGHVCFCEECAKDFTEDKCPICRQKIEHKSKVYFPGRLVE